MSDEVSNLSVRAGSVKVGRFTRYRIEVASGVEHESSIHYQQISLSSRLWYKTEVMGPPMRESRFIKDVKRCVWDITQLVAFLVRREVVDELSESL